MVARRLPRASRVLRDGRTLGYVGEGAGPFASACRSRLSDPVFERFRYTSLVDIAESDIAAALTSAADLADLLGALEALGFATEAITYEDAFGLGGRDAPASPVRQASYERTRSDA